MLPQENLTAAEITLLRQAAVKYFIEKDLNCGLTMMHCLSDFFGLPVHGQVYSAVNGIMEHRTKREQCGLYKGALMFLGIYGAERGWSKEQTSIAALSLAEAFEELFHSIKCYELRTNDFKNPSACNDLAVNAVLFTAGFIKGLEK